MANDIPGYVKIVEPELKVLDQPACKHLRSKGMYITGLMNPADDPYGMGDGHCWCNETAGQLGPDRELADRARCNNLRSCYEPLA